MELKTIGHAARAIRKMPVMASVIIVSLGAGIGVNAAVFSWLQAVVLRPIPGVRDAARFELVEAVTEVGDHPGVSWLEYRDLRERLGSFRNLMAFRMVPLNLGEQGRVERTYGELVSGNYLSGLGLEPALGRFFLPDEVAQPGGSPIAMISHGFWRSRLAGSPGVIGQTIRVNGRELTIRMFAGLGPLLLVLAAIGIYAVVAHTVARRTNEIGVRLALGATARPVIGQLVADSVRVASVGGAIGWVLAFLVYIHAAPGRPIDPFAFVGVPALLLLVAAFASWLPARRASTAIALRRE